MNQIRADRVRYLDLQIVRQSMDVPLEREMGAFLVEDQNTDTMGYIDFICNIYRSIQSELMRT